MNTNTVFKTLPDGVKVDLSTCEGRVGEVSTKNVDKEPVNIGVTAKVILRNKGTDDRYEAVIVPGVVRFIWGDKMVLFNHFGVIAIFNGKDVIGWAQWVDKYPEPFPGETEPKDIPKNIAATSDGETTPLPRLEEIDVLDEVKPIDIYDENEWEELLGPKDA